VKAFDLNTVVYIWEKTSPLSRRGWYQQGHLGKKWIRGREKKDVKEKEKGKRKWESKLIKYVQIENR
jgi:hypothetical protein